MAQFVEYLKMAIGNIKSNKGRSFLTMLGIIIGISSVIMVISIGDGAKKTINSELDGMIGGGLWIYLDGSKISDDQWMTLEDVEALNSKVPHVKVATMDITMGGTVKAGIKDFDAYVEGGTSGMEFAYKEKVIKGNYFTDSDVYSGRKVCVISARNAKKLFGTTDVIGVTVEITVNNITQDFVVIGIREDNSAKLLAAMANSDTVGIEIPYTALGQGFACDVDSFDGVYVVADSSKTSSAVADSSISLLERRKGFDPKDDIVLIRNFADYMSGTTKVLGYVTIFIVFVAGISLVVGGIGVMNIMLVSVTERTREIGIRKSLGAKTGSILLQFLSESAIITLIGGILGISIGLAGAYIVSAAVGFTASVNISTVLIATLSSSGVGIVFGVYPARKAARLSPIEALRHE